MSELDELLEREGVADVGDLMKWAHGRTEDLLSEASEDAELGQLLEAGGQAGPAPAAAEAPAAEQGVESEAAAEAPAKPEPSKAAPLPPIPSVARAQQQDDDAEEVDLDEIEELDMEELELVEDEDEQENGDASEGVASEAEGDGAPEGDEPPAAEPPAAPKSKDPSTAFGPPDGTDEVPEWKAALMSTQTESDAEAAAQIKEASSAEPLPDAPVEPPMSGRLEAEDDEISQHSIDFSDLDTDDE
ncbi:MAG: hypothetical protein AAGA54_31200 [Myxococcota bacterium]